jgi:hypothetical protein
MKPFDDDVEGLFADLRAEDTARAPRFSALFASARAQTAAVKRPVRSSSAWWLAAAAGVVIAATLLARQLGRDAGPTDASADPVSYPSIESWTPPTDALLRHVHAATTAPPTKFGSILDGLTTGSTSSNPYK